MTVDTKENPITVPSHKLPAYGSESHRYRLWWIILGIVLLLAIAAYLLWGRHENAKKMAAPGPPKTTITTATANKGDIGVYLNAIGTVTPVYTDSITSQVTGVVVAVHFKEGQVVKKGDPLVDIDSRPFRATLLQAQGAL